MVRSGMERKTDVACVHPGDRISGTDRQGTEHVKITISGASGFIGRRLLKISGKRRPHLAGAQPARGHQSAAAASRCRLGIPTKGEPPAESLRDADAVIHLAGEPVAQRWNERGEAAHPRKPRDGDAQSGAGAGEAAAEAAGVLICASAIGYYGSRGDEMLTESSAPGSGYPAGGVRGVGEGGAGGRSARNPGGADADRDRAGRARRRAAADAAAVPHGRGREAGRRQAVDAWIHLEDLAGIFRFALENRCAGAVNGVAPNPVTNAEFTRTLAAALHRPAIFPVPRVRAEAAVRRDGGGAAGEPAGGAEGGGSGGIPVPVPAAGRRRWPTC